MATIKSKILDQKEITVAHSNMVLGFETLHDPEKNGNVFERVPLFWCDVPREPNGAFSNRYFKTGDFTFHASIWDIDMWFDGRQSKSCYVPPVPPKIAKQLKEGLIAVDQKVLNHFVQLLDWGQYIVVFKTIMPKIGDQNYPVGPDYDVEGLTAPIPYFSNPYYYLGTKQVSGDQFKFQEYIVPLQNAENLNQNIVDGYRGLIKKGKTPTVVTFGLYDQKDPFVELDPERPLAVDYHQKPNKYFLNHYLLDGHHKLKAAALEQSAITMLSFIRKENYGGLFLTKEQIENWIVE